MAAHLLRDFMLFLFLCALPLAICDAQGANSESAGFELHSGGRTLGVRAQTADEAYGHLTGVLAEMDFFRANGYGVALPEHPAFAPEASTPGPAEIFEDEVYNAAAFDRALEGLGADQEVLRRALDWFDAAADIEGFRAFDRYEVRLTLYGPGGSFDPETGVIVLLTTPDGRFKGGGGTHTIIHEMMHLAVEEGLVRRFGLGHWEKERLVDLLVRREFAELLPDYVLQSQGEQALDAFVEEVPLAQITAALDRYRSARE